MKSAQHGVLTACTAKQCILVSLFYCYDVSAFILFTVTLFFFFFSLFSHLVFFNTAGFLYVFRVLEYSLDKLAEKALHVVFTSWE